MADGRAARRARRAARRDREGGARRNRGDQHKRWAAFQLDGKGLVCYAAFKDHYSLFPMSKQVIADNAEELGARATGKGTIQFTYDERLPVRLVQKIVKARVAEVASKQKPAAR